MNKTLLICVFFLSVMACPGTGAFADTIYLRNGRSLEGIVKAENKSTIEVDIGFGTITCNKGEVEKVERSTPEERGVISARWDAERKELRAKEEEFFRAREKRFAEYESWARESEQKKQAQGTSPGVIPVRRDAGSRGIFVDSLLNNDVNALLLLDTGASVVVLTKGIGEKLGFKADDTKKDIAVMHLPGDRKVDARMVIIKSIRIKDVEVKDVLAAILMEDITDGSFKDGLLGMTFLSKFNLKIDLKDMKMSLEKLK